MHVAPCGQRYLYVTQRFPFFCISAYFALSATAKDNSTLLTLLALLIPL